MPEEHEFLDDFGPCTKCGKYVEELMNKRFCTGKKEPRDETQEKEPYWLKD